MTNNHTRTQSNAQVTCVTEGGNLAAVRSVAEAAWFFTFAGSRQAWIGATDVAEEG